MGGLVLALFRRPAAALGGVLCTYGFEQWAQANHSFFLTHATFTNYLTGCVLLLALMITVLKGRQIFTGYPMAGWLTLAMFTFALVTMLWSVYPKATLDNWHAAWPYITIVVLLSPLLIINPRDIYDGLIATLALGVVVLLLLFFTTESVDRNVVLGADALIGGNIEAGNPLAIATLAGYVALIAVLMNFQGVARFWQVVRWGVFAVAMMISIQSGSRGQLIATLIAVLMFMPISRRMKSVGGFIGFAVGVVMISGLVMWAYSLFASVDRWEGENLVDTYFNTRIETSLLVLRYWADSSPVHWFLGLGSSASYAPFLLGIYPHFVMAEVLAEEGFVGLTLFCSVLFLAVRSMIRIYPYTKLYPDARGVLASLGALFMFQLILSFKQGSLLGHTHLFAFAIMLGKFEWGVMRQNKLAEQDQATSTDTIPAGNPT